MIKPVKPDGYCDELSGSWEDVPEWAIRRINFLEEVREFNDKARCPLMHDTCPNVPDMSCHSVKHCYPYLCNGACGHNEIWVSERLSTDQINALQRIIISGVFRIKREINLAMDDELRNNLVVEQELLNSSYKILSGWLPGTERKIEDIYEFVRDKWAKSR
jgi:hypothetical protein